jgi:hypothetical protein
MELNDDRIQKKLVKVEEIQNLQRDKYYDWLRNIITLAIGFFAVIVSLKSNNKQNSLQHFFFIIALSALALGIITGIIILYGEIHLIAKVKKKYFQNIVKMLDDEKVDKFESISINRFFRIVEYACFTFLIVSLLSLVLYSYFTY